MKSVQENGKQQGSVSQLRSSESPKEFHSTNKRYTHFSGSHERYTSPRIKMDRKQDVIKQEIYNAAITKGSN